MLMMLFAGCALLAASCAADAHDARCVCPRPPVLMFMMLCNTGAAGAHDARGSCPRP